MIVATGGVEELKGPEQLGNADDQVAFRQVDARTDAPARPVTQVVSAFGSCVTRRQGWRNIQAEYALVPPIAHYPDACPRH